jgi:hypothetical protein
MVADGYEGQKGKREKGKKWLAQWMTATKLYIYYLIYLIVSL